MLYFSPKCAGKFVTSIALFAVVVGSDQQLFETCYKAAINWTQKCENNVPYYATHMGLASGLGSEMNFYFAKALLLATMRNRRLVYVKSKLEWEYNCESHNGWACYLQFNCQDSAVEKQEMDYATVVRPGNGFMDITEVNQISDAQYVCASLKNTIRLHTPSGSMVLEDGTHCEHIQCDRHLGGIIADIGVKYLYHLNKETLEAVNRINSKYKPLVEKNAKYFGLQMRLTDKKGEMGDASWQWMNNLNNTANMVTSLMSANHLHRLFITTDDCIILPKLKILFDPNISIFSPCLDHSGNLRSDHQQHWERRNGELSAYGVLADIEMLRKADVFAGLYDSNLVRLIHRVRDPDKQSLSYALAADVNQNKEIKDFNKVKPMHLPWGP